ncbi:uncharacterized protein [Henckelia pumila]|uniref:uncharacterized protein n=1 Tax=Henckelia pumila TaxID=405737 RepID=UPI003C6E902F
MSLRKEESAVRRPQLSCVKCFDALWFCYSPVHQMQQYYRLGALDNCSAKWAELFDCLSLKTKTPAQIQAILDEREKSKPHIWLYRSPEEAASNWKKVFGHLDELE